MIKKSFRNHVTVTFSITLVLITISSVTALTPSRSSSRTALAYSNGIHNTETPTRVGFWSNLFPSNRRQVSEQDGVDEYLEFLDRRYNRLRVDEIESSPVRISAWGWLMDDNNKPHPITEKMRKQKNDALYALGVAELASEKLLQKHQISIGKRNAMTSLGGLFGRPKNLVESNAVLKQELKKQMKSRAKAILKVPKQAIIIAPVLTCFLLSARLLVVLGAIFQDS